MVVVMMATLDLVTDAGGVSHRSECGQRRNPNSSLPALASG